MIYFVYRSLIRTFAAANGERCQSGRMDRTRNAAYSYGYPGFESQSLRLHFTLPNPLIPGGFSLLCHYTPSHYILPNGSPPLPGIRLKLCLPKVLFLHSPRRFIYRFAFFLPHSFALLKKLPIFAASTRHQKRSMTTRFQRFTNIECFFSVPPPPFKKGGCQDHTS